MNTRSKCLAVLLTCSAVSCLSACAAKATTKTPLCRIEFDYTDQAVAQLNTANLRALLRFKELCSYR